MLKILLCLTVFIAFVHGRGELIIFHNPSSIHFKGESPLSSSLLREIFSAAMGYSVEKPHSWPGLFITDPFNVAEAVVAVSVDGITNLGGGGHHFPLRTDVDDKDIFDTMKDRIMEHNPVGNSLIVDTDLADGMDIIKEYEFLHGINHIKKSKIMYNFLKHSVDVDRQFIQELNLINAIADEVSKGAIKKDYQPDYYRIKCSGLHAVSDFHGENSTATKEAKQLFLGALSHLNDAFIKAYDGNVLVTIISSDVSHTRREKRATVTNAVRADDDKSIHLSKAYSSDYPVIFNIILWFGVAFVFSLLAISLVIGNMDPGRDSIIYRMTSTRMKKDN